MIGGRGSQSPVARGLRTVDVVLVTAGALLLRGAAGTAWAAPPGPTVAATPEIARVWSPSGSGIRENRLSAVAMNPSDPRIVLAAGGRGTIYRSDDGGRTWTEVARIPFARARGAANPGGDGDDSAGAAASDDELDDDAQQELDELRQDTFQEVFDELEEVLGEDEAERLAEEEADEAVRERREELVQERPADDEADERVAPARVAAVRQFVWDPTFPGLAYAATRAGVWRSGDAGATWVPLHAGVGDAERDATAVAPSAGEPDRMLIATGAGLLLSADGGSSWTNAKGEVGTGEVRTVVVDPERRSTVAAGTPQGVFLSTDGGDTWRKVFAGADVRALAFARGEASRLLAGTSDGLWAITPEEAVPIGVAQFSSPRIRSVVLPAGDPARLYVATSRSVHESRDGGATFVELYRGLPSTDVLALGEDVTASDRLWAATALGLHQLGAQGPVAAIAARTVGPRIVDLVLAADRYAGTDGETLRGWRRAARWSRLLPRVGAVFRRSWDDDVFVDVTEIRDESGNLLGVRRFPSSYDLNRESRFLVLLSWRFDELLQGTARVRLNAVLRSIADDRSKRLSKVARLARERRDMAARLAALPSDSEDRASLEVRIQEITGYLDALTGGLLSRTANAPP